MSSPILSFETSSSGQCGDILTAPPETNRRPVVGFLGCAYFEYWRMFRPGFKDDVIRDLERVAENLRKDYDVVFPGLIDTLDAADSAGRAFPPRSWICWWLPREPMSLTTSRCRPSTMPRRFP